MFAFMGDDSPWDSEVNQPWDSIPAIILGDFGSNDDNVPIVELVNVSDFGVNQFPVGGLVIDEFHVFHGNWPWDWSSRSCHVFSR